MAKLVPSMAHLATHVMNRLQEEKRGQTIEELEKCLKEPQSRILAVLVPLRTEGYLAMSDSGMWTMVREA